MTPALTSATESRELDEPATLDAVANRMQVVVGLTTELRRSITADVQTLVDLERAVDGVVRLLRDIRPKHTEDA